MSPPTLQEITEHFALPVVAAGRGLNTPVRWAHSTDLLEPGAYLRGGELVLTVGSQLAHGDATTRFIRELVSRDCVGVGLGVGDHWDEVPSGLISACESATLALISLPPSVPFIRVTEWLAERRTQDAVTTEHRRGFGSLLSSIAAGTTHPDVILEEIRIVGGNPTYLHVFAFRADFGALLQDSLGANFNLLGETDSVTWLLLPDNHPLPNVLEPHTHARLASLNELPQALESTAFGLGRESAKERLLDLLANSATDIAVATARDILQPVRSHDVENFSHLAETLKVFLEVDCSVSRAARRLHMHPNSVRYRLEKIKDLTGLDPTHFDDQMQLALAIAVLLI